MPTLNQDGKLKINSPRFSLSVKLKKDALPECDIKDDIVKVENKLFFTLRDISEFLNMSYNVVSNIYQNKYLAKGKKWNNNKLCPTIEINKLPVSIVW